jgi:hypothetical protein
VNNKIISSKTKEYTIVSTSDFKKIAYENIERISSQKRINDLVILNVKEKAKLKKGDIDLFYLKSKPFSFYVNYNSYARVSIIISEVNIKDTNTFIDITITLSFNNEKIKINPFMISLKEKLEAYYEKDTLNLTRKL